MLFWGELSEEDDESYSVEMLKKKIREISGPSSMQGYVHVKKAGKSVKRKESEPNIKQGQCNSTNGGQRKTLAKKSKVYQAGMTLLILLLIVD